MDAIRCTCLWALVALLVCTAADGRSPPDKAGASAAGNHGLEFGMHVHSGAAARSQWLEAVSRVLPLGRANGDETISCNGQPFENGTCVGVFQDKVTTDATVNDTEVAVATTSECLGSYVFRAGPSNRSAVSYDTACTGAFRFSQWFNMSSPSGSNASLSLYRCAYDYHYTTSDATVDGKTKGETFYSCKGVEQALSIPSLSAPEGTDAMGSDVEAIAATLLDEGLSPSMPSNSPLGAEASVVKGVDGTLLPAPADPNGDCKTRITCNGEAATRGDTCVGEFSDVVDCGKEGGVDKMVCKGDWYPTTNWASCKGKISTEFNMSYGDEGFFRDTSGCKGLSVTTSNSKGGLSFWSSACQGHAMSSEVSEVHVPPPPSPYWQGGASSGASRGRDETGRRDVWVASVT